MTRVLVTYFDGQNEIKIVFLNFKAHIQSCLTILALNFLEVKPFYSCLALVPTLSIENFSSLVKIFGVTIFKFFYEYFTKDSFLVYQK